MKWFGQECLKGLRVGTQSAEVALFLQFDGGSEFVKVLEVKGSCFSLGSIFGMCLISFSQAWLTDLEVGIWTSTPFSIIVELYLYGIAWSEL